MPCPHRVGYIILKKDSKGACVYEERQEKDTNFITLYGCEHDASFCLWK